MVYLSIQHHSSETVITILSNLIPLKFRCPHALSKFSSTGEEIATRQPQYFWYNTKDTSLMSEVNLLETVVRIHSLKKYPVYYTENNEAD